MLCNVIITFQILVWKKVNYYNNLWCIFLYYRLEWRLITILYNDLVVFHRNLGNYVNIGSYSLETTNSLSWHSLDLCSCNKISTSVLYNITRFCGNCKIIPFLSTDFQNTKSALFQGMDGGEWLLHLLGGRRERGLSCFVLLTGDAWPLNLVIAGDIL